MTAAQGRRLRALWRRTVSLGATTGGRYMRHDMPTHAAALAYRAVLALFPFLLLVIGVARAAGLDAAIVWLLAHRAADAPGREGGALVRWVSTQLQEPSGGGLLSVGAITALWSISAGVRQLGQALAAAAEVPETHAAMTWRRFVTSVIVAPVLVVAVVVAAASLLVTTRVLGVVAGWLRLDAVLAGAIGWLRVPVVLALTVSLLAVVYWRAPGARQSFRRVLPGALLAAVSWTIVSLGFSVALATVLDYGATYGSFGAAIGLLIYLQLSAAVVLLGAELNAALRGRDSAANA